jgi:hypothetical protein
MSNLRNFVEQHVVKKGDAQQSGIAAGREFIERPLDLYYQFH